MLKQRKRQSEMFYECTLDSSSFPILVAKRSYRLQTCCRQLIRNKKMNKIIYFTIFISVLLSCKKDNEARDQKLEKSKSDKIDILANSYLELDRFSGAILVAKNDVIVYNKSFGFANYENKIPFSSTTAFKIGEITELVTKDIANRLNKEVKIEPTDKLSNYLTEIESDITINDLLNQTSDTAYNTLGRFIEKVSGKSYQENIEKYSADLKLENTYFQKIDSLNATGYLYHNYRGKGLEFQKSPIYNLEKAFSSKGLKSTGNDLIKILKSNPKELRINGYLDNDGFSYSLVNDTNNKISIIVLSNRRHPVAKEISNSITAILNDTEYRIPLPREAFDIDKTTLADFSGNYSINENMLFEVIDLNDSLFVIMGNTKIPLVPQSSNQFYMIQTDASMRFLRDSTGIVNSILLLNGFIDSEQTASRIK